MDELLLIDPVQVRMARAALGWTRDELAVRADVSLNTIVRLESGDRTPKRLIQKSIRHALESAGMRFPNAVTVDASGVIARETGQANAA